MDGARAKGDGRLAKAGGDTRDVLAGLGYDNDAIAVLLEAGAVEQGDG